MQPKHPIHLIGNAHLDPVWLWRWQEGFAEVKATFLSALDRMDEFPDFVFTCACAAYYRWVEVNDPPLFKRIKKLIEEGRWVIVGGWWIQPDCNIPCGESFVRHALYSQHYFRSRFGKIAHTGYNVDSFGHNGMLPQILSKSGMQNYVFLRPNKQENPHVPGDIFWWESMDGSRVLTYRIPNGYGLWADKDNLYSAMEVRINETIEVIERSNLPHMAFYGVANHGGGPTIQQLSVCAAKQQELGHDLLKHSSPNVYFDSIRSIEPELPVHRADLQHHASACYSTTAAVKSANRKAEHRLLSAEKMTVLANTLLGEKKPVHALSDAWEKVMFNQFHDIMGGCSIYEAYQDVMEFYGQSLTMAGEVQNDAEQRIAWAIDTSKGLPPRPSKVDFLLWDDMERGTPIVVFNPHAWEVTAPIQLDHEVIGVTDDHGNALDIQRVRASRINFADKWDSLFMAVLPPLGYRLFWAYLAKSFTAAPSTRSLHGGACWMENDWVRMELDPASGHIQKLVHKPSGRNVLAAPASPVVVDVEHIDTWAHDVFTFDKDVGTFGHAKVELVEEGPLRMRLRVTSRYGQSTLKQNYLLYRDKPAVEVKAQLFWQEPHHMLKLSFPVNTQDPKATYEIPYGHIVRATRGEEDPGQQWIDVSGSDLGLSLLNNSKYSFSVKDNDMRMTVVNASVYADHFGQQERDDDCIYMDLGQQFFEYTLLPHAGDWREANTVQQAYELNAKPSHILETYHTGPLPASGSALSIDTNQVIASVLKPAEDGKGTILRCYEIHGTSVHARITLPTLCRDLEADFGACEIKTFFIPAAADRPIEEVNLIEW